jgi:hypothetical protein
VVLKLRVARQRKRAKYGRCEGAKPYGTLPGEAETLKREEKMKLMRTLLIFALAGLAIGQGVISWTKSQVIPIVVVVPSGYGTFVPRDGPPSKDYTSWSSRQVVPFLEVELSGTGRFKARGEEVGFVTWGRSDIKPLVMVEPNTYGSFVPK